MKYLDEGFYYKVYDIGDDRVFKEYQSYYYSFKKVFVLHRERNNVPFFRSLKIAHQSVTKEQKTLYEMKRRLKTLPGEMFGNPTFVDNVLNYTQDRVAPLGEYLESHSIEDNKKMLDLYFHIQKELWSKGIHDKIYKFHSSYGVTKDNKVVVIDFGETLFTKEETLESVISKKWLSRSKYKAWEESETKDYYTFGMNALMTKENLNKFWKNP